MTDEDLIGYLLGVLDPDQQIAVDAHVRANSGATARLEDLRSTFRLLESDREPPAVPVGLAIRTIARVAMHVAEHEPNQSAPVGVEAIALSVAPVVLAEKSLAFRAEPRPRRAPPRVEPELTTLGGRFRFDIVIAGCIAVAAFGLLFSGIGRLRAQNQMVACQNTLRTVHVGLTGYADAHGGHFPQVGVGTNPTADTFAQKLHNFMPVGFQPCCPASPNPPANAVGYTYTLGYRGPGGGLLGLTRPDENSAERDLVPISADFPTASTAPTAGPTCPHKPGMNVLYVGGNVRPTTSALVGPNGDDIFRNLRGDVAAGADLRDVVLGRPGDRP